MATPGSSPGNIPTVGVPCETGRNGTVYFLLAGKGAGAKPFLPNLKLGRSRLRLLARRRGRAMS